MGTSAEVGTGKLAEAMAALPAPRLCLPRHGLGWLGFFSQGCFLQFIIPWPPVGQGDRPGIAARMTSDLAKSLSSPGQCKPREQPGLRQQVLKKKTKRSAQKPHRYQPAKGPFLSHTFCGPFHITTPLEVMLGGGGGVGLGYIRNVTRRASPDVSLGQRAFQPRRPRFSPEATFQSFSLRGHQKT